MSNPKPPLPGVDWTQLLTDPDLVKHLGELLQIYREASPEKRDRLLLEAMRDIKKGKPNLAESASAPVSREPLAEPVPQPVATSPSATPPFEPDIFTPSWGQDRRRFPRLKCFVAVELKVGDSAVPIWGNLANTSIGGCFVETATPVATGTSVEIGLWLANGKIWIKGIILTGIVTRSSPSFGLRVQFSELEPSERETLRYFLRFVESTTKEYRNEQAYMAELKR
jgi:PilZ domain